MQLDLTKIIVVLIVLYALFGTEILEPYWGWGWNRWGYPYRYGYYGGWRYPRWGWGYSRPFYRRWRGYWW